MSPPPPSSPGRQLRGHSAQARGTAGRQAAADTPDVLAGGAQGAGSPEVLNPTPCPPPGPARQEERPPKAAEPPSSPGPCNWGHSDGKDGEKEDSGRPRGGVLETPTSPPTPSPPPRAGPGRGGLSPPPGRESRSLLPRPEPGPSGRARPWAGGSGVGCSWQCGWRARAARGADY